MMISVIIPTCNRNELLGKCLTNLHHSVQHFDALNYEVIVTDDSLDCVAQNFIGKNYNWVKWVQGPKKGPAANRNNGAKHANGEWLVFLDDDVLPDKNILQRYKESIKKYTDVLAFEGAIIPDNPETLKKDMAECPVNTKGGCFWSANICIERKLFENIDGFNEQFVIAAQEDQEIYLRILQKTGVIFCKDCVVKHPVRYRKLGNKIKNIPVEIKNWIIFARLKKSWIEVFIDGSTSQIKACLKTIQQKKFGLVIYHFFSLAYLIPGIILSFLQQHGKQKI